MKKPLLTFIIAADLTVIGGASFVLMNRLQQDNLAALPTEPGTRQRRVGEEVPEARQSERPATLTSAPAAAPEIKHRILFQLRAPKAKRVQIIGDFTDELPQDMLKDKKQVWTITLPISPGVYTYNYVIDDQRKIRDPNNVRTTPDHKSILTVKGSQ